MKYWLFGAALALLTATQRPAQAQDLGGALDLPQLGQTLTMSAAIRAQAERDAARKGIKLNDGATGTAAKSRTAAGAVRLTYVPTAALQRQTVENLARRLQARNATQAQVVRTAFGPGKSSYAQLYTANLKGSGFPDNDAASALAAYMEVAYVAANNIRDTKAITPAMDRGLRNQVASLLRQNPAARTPATVAQLGEEMKLQTIILMSGWQESLKTGQQKTFGATIAQQFTNQFHFDLTQVRLTERGFVPR